MDDPVNKTERIEDQIADPESIPDKLTVEDPGKEEKDSGSEFEWRPDIEILFRQPIYSSDTGPRFPQELIERVCEFLWDEPVQLASGRSPVEPKRPCKIMRIHSHPFVMRHVANASGK
ncbi:hypothetical protein EVJ58_g1289 [Rhodofomes roseus]|uniref:Uncharacterized protein n=1 Tax=Rhodofomes roseus TaxID=34475 RepID=A0A4Y9Z283_9APHY|nr:hypothetical protein EVJ58_g1289 [Rhodofomes roseus]